MFGLEGSKQRAGALEREAGVKAVNTVGNCQCRILVSAFPLSFRFLVRIFWYAMLDTPDVLCFPSVCDLSLERQTLSP